MPRSQRQDGRLTAAQPILNQRRPKLGLVDGARAYVRKLPVTLACCGLLLYATVVGLADSFTSGHMSDWPAFFTAGRLAATGVNPYLLTATASTFMWHGQLEQLVNQNPPVSLLVFMPMSALHPVLGYKLVYWASLAAFLFCVGSLWWTYRDRIGVLHVCATACLVPLWNTLAEGQIYLILAPAAVGAWLLLRNERFLEAGVLIGLIVAVKPNFLVWPALLFVGRYRRTAISSATTAAASSMAPVLVFGLSIYADWVAAMVKYTPSLDIVSNGSLPALAARVGAPWLGLPASVGLLAALALWAWTRRPGIEPLSSAGLLAALFASPIAWSGYLLIALPLLFVRRWGVFGWAAIALLIVPGRPQFDLAVEYPDLAVVFGSVAFAAFVLLAANVFLTLPSLQSVSLRRAHQVLQNSLPV